jgi:hypothetical protein
MKIHQLLSGVNIAITNEENRFIKKYNNNISLMGLDDHDQWLAQSLVRKGVYSLSKDSRQLIKNLHETSN